jgi:hypothetical protein
LGQPNWEAGVCVLRKVYYNLSRRVRRMNKPLFIVLGVALVSALLTALLLQRHFQTQLSAAARRLRQSEMRIARLETENERLSNQVATAWLATSHTKRQLDELRRFRGKPAPPVPVQAAPAAALPAVPEVPSTQTLSALPAVEVQGIPKEAWVFAGYENPTNALQTVMWAMSTGDVATFLGSLTPEAREQVTRDFTGKSDADIAALLKQEVGQIGALRPDRVRDVSDTETSFVLFSHEQDNGSTKTRDEAILTFRVVAGEWKLTGF